MPLYVWLIGLNLRMTTSVNGRVGTQKHKLKVVFEEPRKVRVFSDEGFEMSIDLSKRSLTTADDPYNCCGDRFFLPPAAITNNVTACCGYWEQNKIKIDALDQDNFAWLWLSIVSDFRFF